MKTLLNAQEVYLIERYISLDYYREMRDAWRSMLDVLEQALDDFMRHLPPNYRDRPLFEQPDIAWGERVLPNFRDTMLYLEMGYKKLEAGDYSGLHSASAGITGGFRGVSDSWDGWMSEETKSFYLTLQYKAVELASNIQSVIYQRFSVGALTFDYSESNRGPLSLPDSLPVYRLNPKVKVSTGQLITQTGIYLPDADDCAANFLMADGEKLAPEAEAWANMDAFYAAEAEGEWLCPESNYIPATWTLIERISDTGTPIQSLPEDSVTAKPNSVELHYHYDDLRPVENALFKIQFADGSIRKGQLDTNGYARLEGVPEGEYNVEFQAGYDCTLVYVLWRQWMLEFTAGKPIEELATQFAKVVDAFVAKHKAEFVCQFELAKEPDTFEINPDFAVETSPIDIDVSWEYSEWLQLMGAAILLRDETSAQRIAQWSESNVNYDGLFDQFYLRYLDDVDPVGELTYPQTFDPLFDTFFADTPEEAQTLLKEFMAGWHQFQSQAPWHDECGCWSFEAGAVAFLLDIDDSDIDHIAYPHDLVAYARKLRAENRYTSPRQELKKLKLRAGDACPKDGWWWSPAGGWPQQFKAGDNLPKLESDCGDGHWYWHGLTE